MFEFLKLHTFKNLINQKSACGSEGKIKLKPPRPTEISTVLKTNSKTKPTHIMNERIPKV
jgi:hypothetical protein